MLHSLINKDTIVRKEILTTVLETNNCILLEKIDFMIKCLIKIKDLDTFISGVILLNRNNYFGTYSLDFNRDIIKFVLEKNEEKFLKKFKDYEMSQIFRNNLVDREDLEDVKKHYQIEKLVYFYLYHKKYYDCFYKINIENIQKLKTEIYDIKDINKNIKYFSNKNTISVKKGKETETLDIIEVIFKIFEDVKINYKLDNYIKSNYRTEYLFIKNYLEKSREI